MSESRPYTRCIAQFVTKKAVPSHDILDLISLFSYTCQTLDSPFTSANVSTYNRRSCAYTRLIEETDKESSSDTKVD
jgi:hypothetical protein